MIDSSLGYWYFFFFYSLKLRVNNYEQIAKTGKQMVKARLFLGETSRMDALGSSPFLCFAT